MDTVMMDDHTQRHTDTHTDIHRHTQTDRQTDRRRVGVTGCFTGELIKCLIVCRVDAIIY